MAGWRKEAAMQKRQQDYAPMYRKIMQEIMDDISSGIYEPGDLIPSQFDLADRYQVSRVTVREAIGQLVGRGILQTQRGKGTYVADPTGVHPDRNRNEGLSYSLTKSAARYSEEVFSRLVFLGEVNADRHISKKLQIEQGEPVMKIVRVRYVSAKPIALETSYIPLKYVHQVDFEHADLERGSLYRLLAEQAGIRFKYADEAFTAILCPEQMTQYFGFDGEPMISVRRVGYTADDTPVEYCENYQRTDIWQIKVRTYTQTTF